MRKRRHRATFYFFPALLPLAEILPWVFGLLAAVTGAAGFSLPKFLRAHRWKIFIIAALLLSVAGGIYLYNRPAAEVQMAGTRLIAPENFPVPQVVADTTFMPAETYSRFKPLWTMNMSPQILATPVIAGNHLIHGTYANTVEAASLNGKRAWSLQLKAPILAMTKGVGDVVYSGEGLHETAAAGFTAIDAKTGKVLWQREFLGHLENPATLSPDRSTIWLGTGPGGLWSLDAANGHVRWHQPLGHIDAIPLFYRGTLYVPADTDEKNHQTFFYAVNAQTGAVKWSLPQPGQPWGAPVMNKTGEIILTTTGRGQIGVTKDTDDGWAQAISLDGKLLWQVAMPGMVLQPSPYLRDEDIIIHTTKTGYLVAQRGADGSIVWQKKVANEFQTSSALMTGFKIPMLASIAFDGTFTVHNAATGQELLRTKSGTHSTAAPVVNGDVIYISAVRSVMAVGGLHTLAEMK